MDLTTRMGGLLTAPGGGAWVTIERGGAYAIGRARPDGRFTRTPVAGAPDPGVVGPDGKAWYLTRGDTIVPDARQLIRVDGEGAVEPLPTGGVEGLLGTSAEGRLVARTDVPDRFALIGADGTVAQAPSGRQECDDDTFFPEPLAVAAATDGALWLSDGCGRLLRNGALVTQFARPASGLAADPAGGVWLRILGDRSTRTLAHAHADGTVEFITPRVRDISDHAVAPDGSVWLALGSCTLARVTPDGVLSTAPAPLPATQLAFDGTGELWLANRLRLARGLGGPCDDVAPKARVPKRISLRALERGISARVGEPAALRVGALVNRSGTSTRRPRVVPAGGSVRYRLPREQLRQLQRARRPRMTVIVDVLDRDGNAETQEFRVRVTR